MQIHVMKGWVIEMARVPYICCLHAGAEPGLLHPVRAAPGAGPADRPDDPRRGGQPVPGRQLPWGFQPRRRGHGRARAGRGGRRAAAAPRPSPWTWPACRACATSTSTPAASQRSLRCVATPWVHSVRVLLCTLPATAIFSRRGGHTHLVGGRCCDKVMIASESAACLREQPRCQWHLVRQCICPAA